MKRILPLFHAVVKFCSANRLFVFFHIDLSLYFLHNCAEEDLLVQCLVLIIIKIYDQ